LFLLAGKLLPARAYRGNFLKAKAKNKEVLKDFVDSLQCQEERDNVSVDLSSPDGERFQGFVSSQKALVCIEDPFNPMVATHSFVLVPD